MPKNYTPLPPGQKQVCHAGADAMLLRRTAGTRRKIAAIVAASDFGNRQYGSKEHWGPVCKALGITPELLREAVLQHRSLSVFNNPEAKDHVILRMTSEFKAEVLAFCKERRWKISPLCLTLADEYLHGTTEPAHLTFGRRSSKEGFLAPGDKHGGVRVDISCTFTMRHALALRASNIGSTTTGIFRGLLLDVMRGSRPPPIRLLLRRELQSRADYLLPSALAAEPVTRTGVYTPSIVDVDFTDPADAEPFTVLSDAPSDAEPFTVLSDAPSDAEP